MSLVAMSILFLGLAQDPQTAEAQPLARSQEAPSNHQYIRPDPNGATVTSGRFIDNERRAAFEAWRREVHDRERAAQQANSQQQRMRLADRLDRMITRGDCDTAEDTAKRSGWTDIADEVARVCQSRITS